MARAGSKSPSKSLSLISNLVFVILLVFFFLNQSRYAFPLYLRRNPSKSLHRWSSQLSRSNCVSNKKNNAVPTGPGINLSVVSRNLAEKDYTPSCSGVKRHLNFTSECEYIKAQENCSSGGFFDYIEFFYCACGKVPVIGYIVLGLWLVGLFNMLGNTASDYFCCSLEILSNLLQLSPTVTGATLLPLGNGAPDVFASIAAFVGADAGQLALNSVLGGTVIVTCVVTGSISLLVAGTGVCLDRGCFVRDICFFLFTLASLCAILIVGRINLWGALGFVSIYLVYVITIATKEYLGKKAQKFDFESMNSLHSVEGGNLFAPCVEDNSSVLRPLLDPEAVILTDLAAHSESRPLPQWVWSSNVAININQTLGKAGKSSRCLWGWTEEVEAEEKKTSWCRSVLLVLELPLSLPRRLTIPIVEESRWSKGYAVTSVVIAPLLWAFLWNSQEIKPFGIGRAAYVFGGILGSVQGTVAFFTTEAEHPPRRFVFPWVAVGFMMSILWFYVIANELVALLVSFATILDISPSLLGLTVLAWGNSLNDLMSDIALALNGEKGVQISMSACYAGPMFNTLAGLGLSFVVEAWRNQPTFIIPEDDTLFYTLGFLVTGLLWALVILPGNNMHPSKLLGIGLLVLYSLFLLFRLGKYFGML